MAPASGWLINCIAGQWPATEQGFNKCELELAVGTQTVIPGLERFKQNVWKPQQQPGLHSKFQASVCSDHYTITDEIIIWTR